MRVRRQVCLTDRPEFVEARHDHVAFRDALAEAFVHVLYPIARGATFRELVVDIEPFGELCECLVIVACVTERLHHSRHGDDIAVVASGAHVVALEGCGRRQHDVGVARRRGPERLVYHHGVGTSERAAQAIQVLVMVERVASRPVHETDVREA